MATVAFFVMSGIFFPLVDEGGPLLNAANDHLVVVQLVLVAWSLALLTGPLRAGGQPPVVTAPT